MVDPIPDFPKLLFDVRRDVDVGDVSALDHLSVDEEGQLQESRVRDRASQVGAVEQRDLLKERKLFIWYLFQTKRNCHNCCEQICIKY